MKLVRIEKDRHRLGLSLRQARSDAEAMGFAFDVNGSVVDYPDDVREQFSLPPREEGTEAPQRRAEPRTAAEAIERAVARDPEPVSAFASAFAKALESADSSNPFAAAREDLNADETEPAQSGEDKTAETVNNENAASPEAVVSQASSTEDVADSEASSTGDAVASSGEETAVDG